MRPKGIMGFDGAVLIIDNSISGDIAFCFLKNIF